MLSLLSGYGLILIVWEFSLRSLGAMGLSS